MFQKGETKEKTQKKTIMRGNHYTVMHFGMLKEERGEKWSLAHMRSTKKKKMEEEGE